MVELFPRDTLITFYMTLNHGKGSIPGIHTFGLDPDTISKNMPTLVSLISSSRDITKDDIHKLAGEVHAFRHKQDEETKTEMFKLMEQFGIRFNVPFDTLKTAGAVATVASSTVPPASTVELPSLYYDDDDELMGDDNPFPIDTKPKGGRKGTKSRKSRKSKKSNKRKKTRKSKKSLKVNKSKKSRK